MLLVENSSGHIDCVWSHLSLVESSSGQAGSNRALTSSPVDSMLPIGRSSIRAAFPKEPRVLSFKPFSQEK